MTNASLLLESSVPASPRPASLGILARHQSERWPGIAGIRTQYQSLDQFPMEDALNVCERYLSQLEADYQAWRLFYSERMRSKA